jgi:hypothetical protein
VGNGGDWGDLNQCGASIEWPHERMWQPVSTAPCDRDLELSVIDYDGARALVSPLPPHPMRWRHRDASCGWVKEGTETGRSSPDLLASVGSGSDGF